MAYVYADMGAMAAYQQEFVQILAILQGQVNCKEDLIEETKKTIKAAIERAEEAEHQAYSALVEAEEQLREAERRTREYNDRLPEGESPMETPACYREAVEECQTAYSAAQATRLHAENTLSEFESYVRRYQQQQEEGFNRFVELATKSKEFFESYIKKLVEVKTCTSGFDKAASSGSGRKSHPAASGEYAPSVSPAESVKAAGEQWTNGLSPQQRTALCSYTGSAYVNINATLRGLHTEFDPGNREKAVLIHQALASARIPQACTVYRGASNAALGDLKDVPDDQLVGSFFSDNGFMSTSINSEDAFDGDIRLIISVPAGARGAYVGYLSHLGHRESEVLFDVGAVMRITKVERSPNGKRMVYVQMM